VLADPQLRISGAVSAETFASGWGGNSLVSATAAAVGAFAWTDASSLDEAVAEALPQGTYSARVSGESGDTGIALAELFDATPAGTYTPSMPRLTNVSARAVAGPGQDQIIAGFVIGGSTSKTVLIRASGPALAAFGVTGALADPELHLFGASPGNAALASNGGWGGSPEIAAAAASVGAFKWADAASGDSAILVTLAPGSYTAQVSGASGDTGVVLVEVYDVP
jgi:hypothetical protein